jgi:hypothetical protein
MAGHSKTASGGGKDKVLRRIVESVDDLTDVQRTATTARLCATIASVRIRTKCYDALTPAQVASPPAQVVMPSAPAAAPVFDPYAFSVVAVLARKGAAAVASELERIVDPAHLHALANAQHLGVDPGLTDPEALRAAMLAGAQRRLADRKAAAG